MTMDSVSERRAQTRFNVHPQLRADPARTTLVITESAMTTQLLSRWPLLTVPPRVVSSSGISC